MSRSVRRRSSWLAGLGGPYLRPPAAASVGRGPLSTADPCSTCQLPHTARRLMGGVPDQPQVWASFSDVREARDDCSSLLPTINSNLARKFTVS